MIADWRKILARRRGLQGEVYEWGFDGSDGSDEDLWCESQ